MLLTELQRQSRFPSAFGGIADFYPLSAACNILRPNRTFRLSLLDLGGIGFVRWPFRQRRIVESTGCLLMKKAVFYFRIPLLCVGLLLLLAVGWEAGLRLSGQQMDLLSLRPVAPSALEPNVFEYHAAAGWRLRPSLCDVPAYATRITTNAQGLRMGYDVGIKPKTCLRIACFGDSATFGAGVSAAPHSTSTDADDAAPAGPYPQTLERLLRETFPGREIQVLNMGCPGHSILRGEAYLRSTISKFRPDIVTFCYLGEDVSIHGFRDTRLLHLPSWERTMRGIAPDSRIAASMLARWQTPSRRPLVDDVPLPRVSLEDYVMAAARVRDFCLSEGVKFLLMSPPVCRPKIEHELLARAMEYRKAGMNLCTWHNTPGCELASMAPDATDSEHLFLDGWHPNADGHTRVAEDLRQSLFYMVRSRLNDIREGYPDLFATHAGS